MPLRARLDTNRIAAKPFHHIWWAFMRLRLLQVKSQLPEDLKGSIQIVIDRGIGTKPTYLYLDLAGPNTEAGEGKLIEPQTWIQTSEQELGDMLFSRSGGMEIKGDPEPYNRIFEFLTDSPDPSN